MAKILFINASENRHGNTARLGNKLLAGEDFDQVNLVDYKIYQIGQDFADDQFAVIYHQMAAADTIILGTPVYWHDMSAYLKTLIERISQRSGSNELAGRRVGLLIQGANPLDAIKPVSSIIKRFCQVAGMTYIGNASTTLGLAKLKKQLND